MVRFRLDRIGRVSLRLCKMRRVMRIDTQRVRLRLMINLEQIFHIACAYARGQNNRVVGKDGKQRYLTVSERQLWARIATYTAQIIDSVAKGIDERQIDKDLDKLEEMLNKTETPVTVSADGRGPPGKSEVA